MNNGFYRAFEERYRGSRNLIKMRLAAYLPFVEPLLDAYPVAEAIDLGCGRGEWLELLVESGFKPLGVDLDSGMLDACQKLGLPVEKADALSFLCGLPDESQAVVSAFHFVEHIRFEELQNLVAEALRVLKPGGLLIMETPNPENIVVATRNFYLDPTHQRPIPPLLLSFTAEYAGFSRVKTLRLQESRDLLEKNSITLQDVLSGVSPDYAVVAQKYGPSAILELTMCPFGRDYGVSLENLICRWDDRFAHTESKAQEAESKAQEAESKAQEAESKAQQSMDLAESAMAKSDYYHSQLMAVYTSTSWTLTKPVRWTMDRIRGLKRLRAHAVVKEHSKSILTERVDVLTHLNPTCLKKAARYAGQLRSWSRAFPRKVVIIVERQAVASQPIKRWILGYLSKRPALKAKLRKLVHSSRKDRSAGYVQKSMSPNERNPRQVSYRGLNTVAGNRNTASSVNGEQKTPLESTFY